MNVCFGNGDPFAVIVSRLVGGFATRAFMPVAAFVRRPAFAVRMFYRNLFAVKNEFANSTTKFFQAFLVNVCFSNGDPFAVVVSRLVGGFATRAFMPVTAFVRGPIGGKIVINRFGAVNFDFIKENKAAFDGIFNLNEVYAFCFFKDFPPKHFFLALDLGIYRTCEATYLGIGHAIG